MILVGYMTITWVIIGGENGQNKFSALLVICGIICSLVKWFMQHELFIQQNISHYKHHFPYQSMCKQ